MELVTKERESRVRKIQNNLERFLNRMGDGKLPF